MEKKEVEGKRGREKAKWGGKTVFVGASAFSFIIREKTVAPGAKGKARHEIRQWNEDKG